MLNNILFRSIIIDLMIRDQKRNKRIYKGLLEDLIYYLKKANSDEFDLFSKSNEFEKYYPILTELNLNFVFSIESRNLNTNINAYDLTTVKKILSVFIKNIEYDNDNNKVIINVVPQYEYIFEKLKNEDLTGVDIFSKIKEITSDLKIEKETLPRYFYKWFILVYRNRNSFDTSRIYKSRAYAMNPISNSSFIINVEIDNKIYSFEPGDFKIDINSNMNVVEIKPENLFTSRKYDIERFSTQGTLNEFETSKYNNLLKIQNFHDSISNLVEDIYKKEVMFKQLICGKYQPIRNNDLDLKLDEINYFLSEFDMEINNFNEFEEVVEELLAKNIINIEEIEPFKPLLEKLKDETFVKYLDEVL